MLFAVRTPSLPIARRNTQLVLFPVPVRRRQVAAVPDNSQTPSLLNARRIEIQNRRRLLVHRLP